MVLDLVPLWTVLLGLAVFYYVVFDGFDLGVGMLYGFMPDPDSRDIAMNSIAPIWDGNETWLVFGGTRFAGGFSTRLRHHYSRGLFSDSADAACARLPRRRLRIPL